MFESTDVGLDLVLPEEEFFDELAIVEFSIFCCIALVDGVDVLNREVMTWVSTTMPHLAMALKKSDLVSHPLEFKSKNLKDLKRKASMLTLEDARSCILEKSSL